MATGDQAVTCANPSISLEELIKSALVMASTGEVGLRVLVLTKAAGNISAYPGCSDPSMDATEAFRNAFGVTAAGKTGIVLIQES